MDGETTPPSIAPLVIDRAKIVSKREIVNMVMQGDEADERLLFIDHPTRPFLYWLILPK
jgi:hypothetical protein